MKSLWARWTAKADRQAAELARVQANEALVKAGNLWDEAHADRLAVENLLAASDYRIPRQQGESWPGYKGRIAQILHEGRQAPVTLAILDRLDAKTREGYRDWLIEPDPAKAERLRQRTSGLADFRAELVEALYFLVAKERREEAHRQMQQNRLIYLDAQSNAQPAPRA